MSFILVLFMLIFSVYNTNLNNLTPFISYLLIFIPNIYAFLKINPIYKKLNPNLFNLLFYYSCVFIILAFILIILYNIQNILMLDITSYRRK